MGQQSYAARDWRSRQFRSHTLHLGPNRATRRSLEFRRENSGKNVVANSPYRKDEQGTLLPGGF